MNAKSIARSLPGILFGVLTILLALGNSWLGIYPFGEAVWIRPLLGLVGIVGAICLFCRNGWWRILLAIWCVCQSFVIATDVSDEWFYQGITLGLSSVRSESIKMNELVTSYSARGMNSTGFVLLILLAAIILFHLHPRVRRTTPIWRPILVIAALLIVAFTYSTFRHRGESTATYVLDFDVPNAPIYYKDQFLGRTPLQITSERIADWKLPLDGSKPWRMFAWGWGDCVALSNGKTSLPLYAGVPWPFGRYLDTFNTPWGERCRMSLQTEEGNRHIGCLFPAAALRHEPILEIQTLDAQPILAGGPLRMRCVLRNPTAKNYSGRLATIERHCFSYERRENSPATAPAGMRREIKMPATWNALPAGATMTADLEFDAPLHAGNYELFCTWCLYKSDGSNTGAGGDYSNMLSLQIK